MNTMLKGFSVGNFKSFNEVQTISFAASKGVRHKHHVVDVAGRRILKSGIVFGANAGGKSNLVQAIAFSRDIVLKGLDQANLTKKHFRISRDSYEQPGVFEYHILIGEYEYSYGMAVSYAASEIVNEWLVRISKSGKEFVIFERTLGDGVSQVFTENTNNSNNRLNVYFGDYGENIAPALRQKTMLGDIAARSSDKTGPIGEIVAVYHWFEDMIIIFPNTKYNYVNEIASNDAEKNFFGSILEYFDTGIESIDGQSQKMDLDRLCADMPHETAEEVKARLSHDMTGHQVAMRIGRQTIFLQRDADGNIVYNKLMLNHGNSDELFDYADESDGTKRLFDFIPLLHNRENLSTIIIDEIDRSLHTNLVHRFLELFYSMTEGNNVQLLATTHDSNVMDLDMLRQDEIWFVERQTDHSSKIYSLNKFRERFDKVVKNEYLLGRYGAIPIFNSGLLPEEDSDAD